MTVNLDKSAHVLPPHWLAFAAGPFLPAGTAWGPEAGATMPKAVAELPEQFQSDWCCQLQPEVQPDLAHEQPWNPPEQSKPADKA